MATKTQAKKPAAKKPAKKTPSRGKGAQMETPVAKEKAATRKPAPAKAKRKAK